MLRKETCITCFSNHNGSLRRRQPKATFHVMLLVWCIAGKYTAGGKKPGGPRTAIFSDDKLEKLQPLVGLMKDIGSGHGGKTPAQVAINWVMCKGAIPIVGELFCACGLLLFCCCVRSCAKARSLLLVAFLCLCSSSFLPFAAVLLLCSFALYCAVLRTLLHVLTPLRPCLSCYVFLSLLVGC